MGPSVEKETMFRSERGMFLCQEGKKGGQCPRSRWLMGMKKLMPGGLHFFHWVVMREAVDPEKYALENVGETNQTVTGSSGG